jgi:hypothetical protein
MIKTNKSKFVLYITFFIILFLTYNTGIPFIFRWDTFGYSAYLPMLFINKSIILHDTTFFENINSIYQNTPNLYQFIKLDNGNIITRHTVGWSVVMSPFYLIGHLIAKLFNYPLDGFSAPYNYMVCFGSSFYMFLGLHFLRKTLLTFFNDLITCFLLIILVFGTNFFVMQFVSLSSTHSFVFTFLSILLWLTIKFHDKPSVKNSILIGICIGIIGLIRPPDLIFGLIPFAWNLGKYNGLKGKINYFWSNYKKLVILCVLSCIGTLFIQFSYWKATSGHFLINSYNNAGEGFDWLTPYTFEFLFSFRKGWLLYTPIMLFSIFGLFYWRKKEKSQGNFIVFTFFIFVYVVSCWTTWWYAASYSQRPMVDTYPLLAIGLGYFILEIQKKSSKIIFSGIFITLIGFNLLQSLQFTKGILHLSLMTKAYYFSTFGQLTPPTLSQQKLLLINREEVSINGFTNPQEYKKCFTKKIKLPKNYQLNDSTIYTPIYEFPNKTISKKDHFWVRMTWEYEGNFNQLEGKVMNICALYKTNAYNWLGRSVTDAATRVDTVNKTMSFDYLSPEIRNENDPIRIGIWKMGGLPIVIKSVLIEGFEKIEGFDKKE